MRFAYVDPPYCGCCGLYEHFHGDDGRCWDDVGTHQLLIERVADEYPDGWAMSASASSLQVILPLCPSDTRVSPWCKSFCAFKKGVRPAYSWEPVLWRGGRNPANGYPHAPPSKGGKQTTPKDHLWLDDARPAGLLAPITLKRGFTGAKPVAFVHWILDLLNVHRDDEFHDLFPGSGAVTRAVEAWRAQETLAS